MQWSQEGKGGVKERQNQPIIVGFRCNLNCETEILLQAF